MRLQRGRTVAPQGSNCSPSSCCWRIIVHGRITGRAANLINTGGKDVQHLDSNCGVRIAGSQAGAKLDLESDGRKYIMALTRHMATYFVAPYARLAIAHCRFSLVSVADSRETYRSQLDTMPLRLCADLESVKRAPCRIVYPIFSA